MRSARSVSLSTANLRGELVNQARSRFSGAGRPQRTTGAKDPENESLILDTADNRATTERLRGHRSGEATGILPG